jgi:hypothetical protein
MKELTPIPFPRIHRCRAPVTHGLVVLGGVSAWLWWSLYMVPRIGPLVGWWLSPNGHFTLPIWIIVMYLWLPIIPFGALFLYALGMWQCTGAYRPVPAAPHPPFGAGPAAQPVMIERVYLASDEAARRGMPGSVIVERIHYDRR